MMSGTENGLKEGSRGLKRLYVTAVYCFINEGRQDMGVASFEDNWPNAEMRNLYLWHALYLTPCHASSSEDSLEATSLQFKQQRRRRQQQHPSRR
jgi:hypothetical protein